MLEWSNSRKKNVVLAVENGIDEIIINNLKSMKPFNNEDEWVFTVINHSDLFNTITNPDVIVLSRFLPGGKPNEILKYIKDNYFLSHVVILTGEKSEQSRNYIRLAKSLGFENIVTGNLPGDLPYTLDQAIQFPYQLIMEGKVECLNSNDNSVKTTQGVIVASAGAKGGIGKTSVAAGTTLALARAGVGVTAVDYDYSRQDLTAFFKVPEFHKFTRDSFNAEEVKRSVIPVGKNIYLLPAIGKKAPINFPKPEEVKATLSIMRDTNPVVVVDTPSDLNCSHTPVILQEADIVLVNIDQTAFTDQDIFDYGAFLLETGVNPEKAKIVVNRYSKKLRSIREIVRLFNQGIRSDVKIITTIPNQYEKYATLSYKGQIPGVIDRKSPWQDIVAEIGIDMPQRSSSRFRLKKEA